MLIVKHWKISLKYVLIKFWKPVALKSGHYCTWQNVCKHSIKFWCNHTCIINANEKKLHNTVVIIQVAILGRMHCLVLLFKAECMWDWETAILHPLLFFFCVFFCMFTCMYMYTPRTPCISLTGTITAVSLYSLIHLA